MKFSEDSDQAANYLRQAIPTMVKHSIVPNPLNYTLWYSYFSDAFPELNKELDQAIERYGTCPAKVGENLFIQHISQLDNEDEEQLEAFQKAFSTMVNNLSDSIDQTAKQTNGFSAALKENIDALESHDLGADVAPVLNNLNANASAICDANDQFQGQLSAAQSEINALREELEASRRDANTDPLTGLYNRRVFEAIYKQFMEEESEDDLTLIMMDIDKFKLFNDTHGHLLGDQILKFVGKLLKSECPESITPVRFGGEEFAMLCPKCSLEKGQEVAENIREKLAAVPFNNKKSGAKIPPVTASFGVAMKKQKEELSEIIERADKALYAAKDGGRNQVQLAS
ncbi:GGDEF domain-containing protein [Glaciecola petra]|uniref:diguanylate cyclase n=1 Tax=Glaciecola petra TaxID=3075602 RepID=A0ABU2ZRI6_9ALTE|nr:GGDEF domain-containing protein [Aestuariibacter sp. P117]MDT0594866.1 GGDEF domain-containing protein [Aestuariibacter sp. P117]